ncbi:MAG: hypothetical protein H6Q89_4866 [Myxococcaceae bacterium]|nr:hypothetical protein [Myxococcaceae bacterium]
MAVITALLAALVLAAAPLKTTGPGKALVGAWYQGDTQYLDLLDNGQGRLGMLEMTWKVIEPGNLHLVFKEDGAEKDLTYKLKKGVLTMEVMNREVVLTRGTAKVKPKAASAAELAKDTKKPPEKKPAK